MNKNKWIFLLMVGCCFTTPVSGQKIAVKAQKLYPVSSPMISNGVVLIENGKIISIGKQSDISIPTGFEIVEGVVATPGFIDARNTVGISGIYNAPHDQDQMDGSDPIQPELRALDAFNPKEALISYLREFGITTVQTGHAPGALVNGQTLVFSTGSDDLKTMIVDSTRSLTFTLGPSVTTVFKKPGNRAKGVAMLRSELIKAKEYMIKQANKDVDKRPGKDLKYEALASVLTGQRSAIMTVASVQDIQSALRLGKEFGFIPILDDATEGFLILDDIKASGAWILLPPMLSRQTNLNREYPKLLKEKGIPFVFKGGYEAYVPKTRVILFEAGIAVAHGLSFDAALEAMTLQPAKLLKIDAQVGSLEKGKKADIVVFSGDPFEYTSQVLRVIN